MTSRTTFLRFFVAAVSLLAGALFAGLFTSRGRIAHAAPSVHSDATAKASEETGLER